MKKQLSAALAIVLLIGFTGCQKSPEYAKYRYNFFGTFDTMIEIMAYCKSDKDFDTASDEAEKLFRHLHQLFDKYNTYDGMANIKTINDNAGIAPVKVDKEIIDLILLSKDWYEKTDGAVNIAFGPVLNIWHDYRELYKDNEEHAQLPSMALLQEANELTDINKVIVDTEQSTVYLQELGMSLDVGAVAKGYATDLVAQMLKEKGTNSFILSSGGNVRVGDQPLDGERSTWGVGIQDPALDPNLPNQEYLDILFVNNSSVVSSGNYQRYYTVEGKRIHHVIDPQTLLPANNYAAITVLTEASGIADILSTAIYIMDYETGLQFATEQGFEVMWIYENGEIKTTEGMISKLKTLGGATSVLPK